MLYAILCYDDEAAVESWSKEEEQAVLGKRQSVQQKLAAEGRLGPVARLMPTTAATTVRDGREPLVIDGPFAETKEQLLGFYVVDSISAMWRVADSSPLPGSANCGHGPKQRRRGHAFLRNFTSARCSLHPARPGRVTSAVGRCAPEVVRKSM
jgi:hypothetical protein